MKRFKIYLAVTVLAILLLFVTNSVKAITLSQSLDKSDIAYEDSAMFEIIISWEGGQQNYYFGKPLSPYFDRLKVRGFSSSVKTTTSGEEITTKTFKYVLIPTSSGEGKIDKIEIEYLKMPDSVSGILITEPMLINIADKIPVVMEEESGNSIYFILAGLLIAVAGSAVYIKKVSKKNVETIKPPKIKLLEGLSYLKYSSGTDLKIFQAGLYDLLKDFLKDNSGLDITDIPDDKLEASIETTNLSSAYKEKIRNWLINARRDKFQPVSATPGENIRLENEVRELFEK